MVTKFFPTIVTSTCNRTVEMENVHVTETAAAACRLVVALIRREGKGKENQLLLAQRERDGMIDLFRFQACCQQGQVASQEGATSTTES